MQTIKHRQGIRLASLFFCFYTGNALSIEGVPAMSMTLKSSAFIHQTEIPKRFTCDGLDVSPALSWLKLPQNTKSLALIVDDPDAPDPAAPKLTWVHWLLYNIPPTVSELPGNVAPGDLPKGTLQGKNDWQQTGYKGPCPPIGRHRYFFKLYALDTELPDLNSPNKAPLEQAMAGHIIDQAELIGTYKR
jgi:Raf kinase inhibitor-like YbhB/YbcL family protein